MNTNLKAIVLLTCITAFLLAPWRATLQAQDSITQQIEVLRRDAPSVVPQANEIDKLLLIEAARGSVAIAVDQFLKLAETNYMGWAIPPQTTRRIIRYEERIPYEVRYREELVQIPVFKDIYEEYETFAATGGSSTQARELGRVTRRRRVGRERIGTREEKRLVRDPDGPITRTHYRHGKPVYEDGQDFYQAGVLGANAMIYTALRKSGVPQDHPVLNNMLSELKYHIKNHALSDYTWDVAWLTAAFSNNDEERYDELRQWLIAKLVDGQIVEGPGRGFWGPVCIDTTMLPMMLSYEQRLNEERRAAQESLQERRDDDRRQRRFDEAEFALERYVLGYRFITQQGLRFNDCTSRYNATARPGIVVPVSVAGLPYFYFNQALADMDSTFYALIGIREAYENGYLPAETKRVMTTDNRPVAPPENPVAVLARMAAALTSRQHPNGQWDECNTHQPITSFLPLGLPRLLPDELFELRSPVTHLSTAQGYASLINAGHVVGLNRLLGRYGREAQLAMQAQHDAARSFLAGQTAGRSFNPYDFLLALRGIHRHMGGDEEAHRDLWIRLAFKLVFDQNPDGTWGNPREQGDVFPPSVLEFRMLRAERQHNERERLRNPGEETPFDREQWMQRHRWHRRDYMPSAQIRTAMATLFLSDGVRGPIAGFATRPNAQRVLPPVMAKALELLQTRDKVDVTHIMIDENTIPQDIFGLPVIFVTSDTDFNNKELMNTIREYCDNGGTVVAEMASQAQAQTLRTQLQAFVEGGHTITVPEDAPVFANFMGPIPRLEAIANSSGRPTVYIIPLDTIPASPAVQTAYLLLKDNVIDGFFDQDYAWKLDTHEGPAMRLRALAQLQAGTALPEVNIEAAIRAGEDTGTLVEEPTHAPSTTAPARPSGPLPDEVW